MTARRRPGDGCHLGARAAGCARVLPCYVVMTDSPYRPPIVRVEVTAQWLAEGAARQRAYEISRLVDGCLWTVRPARPAGNPVTQSRKDPRSPSGKIRSLARLVSINDGRADTMGTPCRMTDWGAGFAARTVIAQLREPLTYAAPARLRANTCQTCSCRHPCRCNV